MTIPPVVILGGGLGTRLSDVTKGAPKILVDIAGKPFIQWKLESLIKQGVPSIYLLLGEKSESVIEHLNSHAYPIPIAIVLDGPELKGTGGALKSALNVLPSYFVLTFGDNLLNVPISEFVAKQSFDERNLLVVTRFTGLADKPNIMLSDDIIVAYSKLDNSQATHTDYGYATINSADLANFNAHDKFDLTLFWQSLISEKLLFSYETEQRYYEIGTPESFSETQKWLTDLIKL